MNRPIVFSPAMVWAIDEGKKTQTRLLTTDKLSLCRAGDRLWVRERWRMAADFDGVKQSELPARDTPIDYPSTDFLGRLTGRVRPSIHMPRWASRFTLVVADVRVTRLRGISEDDAIAEGVNSVADYAVLWDSLNAAPGTRWGDNPTIVALAFDVQRHNIDERGWR